MKPINSYILQYKKYVLESQTALDYLVLAWAHLLGALAITGAGRIIYEAITRPSTFSNATWGIFDTLG